MNVREHVVTMIIIVLFLLTASMATRTLRSCSAVLEKEVGFCTFKQLGGLTVKAVVVDEVAIKASKRVNLIMVVVAFVLLFSPGRCK